MPFCDKTGLEQIFLAQITGLPDLGVINILYFTFHLHFLCALVYIIEPAVSLMLKWASEGNFFDNVYLFFSSPKRQPTNRGPVRHSDPGTPLGLTNRGGSRDFDAGAPLHVPSIIEVLNHFVQLGQSFLVYETTTLCDGNL